MKTAIKRFFVGLLVWVGISILCLAGLVDYLFYNGTLSFAIRDCGAFATAWLDQNGNSLRESSEPPLAGACFWANAEYSKTGSDLFGNPVCKAQTDYSDDQGKWSSILFGCYGDSIYVSAIPPVGYVSTTPPVVLSQAGTSQFGFALASIQPVREVYPLEYYAVQTHQAWLEQSNWDRAIYSAEFLLYCLVSFYFATVIAKKAVKTP